VVQRWLILADDLTGAADAAAPFARRGHVTEVIWQETRPADDSVVVACDADSRGLSAAGAAARHRAAAQGLLTSDGALFKKIDSTLRGQPAAEVAALCAVMREMQRPALAICAPANPAMGRTTRDGRVLVRGMPLEQTDTWMQEHSYASGDLTAMFASAGLAASRLSLPQVRGGAALLVEAMRAVAITAAANGSGAVLICDAETDDDLARVAEAAGLLPELGFFVGSAGLAQALSMRLPAITSQRIAFDAHLRGTLVAVGSRARVSRAAALRLAAHLDVTTVRVAPEVLSEESSALILGIGARLARGETVVVLLEGSEPAAGALDAGLVRSFAKSLAFALRQMGGLIVTGGETASALLAQAGVQSIRLLDEIEPGLALGVTCGDIEVPIVTKPGAFGDEESLIRCLERLRRLTE
jgi:D-threonate/D-erythronate kinase